MAIEYRIGWSAGSNASFYSRDPEWIPWDGPEETGEEVEAELHRPSDTTDAAIPRGLAEAIEGSGFDWWIETREVEEADDA